MTAILPALPTEAPAGDTMLVGVMTGVGGLEVRTLPVPRPGPGEVLIRLHATAICTWEQRSFSGAQGNTFPFIGGHEMAGEVVALGPGADTVLAIGDRVTVGAASCGRCHWCMTGRDRVCKAHYAGGVVYGDAWGPGGFAEYKVHPADGVYRIGDAPYAEAALVEPLSCAVHATRLLDVYLAQDAVVLGAGVMGLMNVVALKKRGARVIVSEVDPVRLARARALGADELIDATQVDPVARVKELTEGRGAEAVIAAIGHETANEQGMAMLSDRGRFVLFAAAHPEPTLAIQPNPMHNRETGVVGTLSCDKEDFYAASRLVRYGQVDFSSLVDATYPLTELRAALEHALRPGTYRVVVTM